MIDGGEANTIHTCKNCSNQFIGKYCNQCGEKVYNGHDKKLFHVIEEALHFITHFEGTFLTTCKTFLIKPGQYSFDYVNGIRKKYFKPISFFLMLVIAYLLFPKFQGLNMKLDTYAMDKYGFTWATIPVIKHKMQQQQTTYKIIADQYNQKSPSISKIGLLLFLPLIAVFLNIIFWAKKQPFFDHFILAIELCCFWIFSQFLVLPFFAWLTEKWLPAYTYLFNDGSWLWFLFYAFFGIFTSISFQRFYQRPYWISIPKAILFLFVFSEFIRYVYALIIFYLIMFFV